MLRITARLFCDYCGTEFHSTAEISQPEFTADSIKRLRVDASLRGWKQMPSRHSSETGELADNWTGELADNCKRCSHETLRLVVEAMRQETLRLVVEIERQETGRL